MATYRYIATGPSGRTTGVLTASSEQAVVSELARQNLAPISITPAKAASPSRTRVPASQLALAYRQVGDLLRAGVPLLRAIRLIGRRRTAPKLAAAFTDLADQVEDGVELATAMEQRPEVFRTIHVAMIRAGEKGGFLEQSLERLSEFVQGQVELRRKIVGASVYPVMIAFVGALILLAVFVFFIPQFKELYNDLPEIPAVTQILMAISAAVTSRWYIGLVVLGALVGATWWAARNPNARAAFGRGVMKTPKVGGLLKDLAVARFTRILGTLLASGVPMLAALRIAKDAAGFEAMATAIEEATEAVRSGDTLAQPLGESGLFPDDVLEMISVAESANNLDEVLVGIAETLESRVDRVLTATVKLIEPVLLLSIAAAIVFVAVGLLLPMLKLTSGIQM
ncbi:MAG: type II secretion system F family protein [Phycisphaerales bacterium JB050]